MTILVAVVPRAAEAAASSKTITDEPITPPSNNPSTAWQESISGFVAGGALTVTKTLVKYPLDTITVRLQMPSSRNARDGSNLFQDLYAGIWNPLIANIPGGAVFFAVKDAVKTFLMQQPLIAMSKPWATCIAVFVANFPYWLIRNPSEVIKTKQQAAAVINKDVVSSNNKDTTIPTPSTLSAWQEAFGTERQLAGLYVGYFENIVYAYPADVLKFLLYDLFVSMTTTTTTTILIASSSSAAASPTLSSLEGAALAGALATATAQFITTPLDLVRNRVMTNMTSTGDDNNGENNKNSKSILEILLDIRKREGGVSAWFKGSIPRVGKAFLSGAIQFATYEEMKQQILHLFGVGN
ncbi:hypothetical protein MHU86_22458 [Fragilaria crotonensis]|nr:hypothetical protein MHU86_22458 [Fragilaria crotonensis]